MNSIKSIVYAINHKFKSSGIQLSFYLYYQVEALFYFTLQRKIKMMSANNIIIMETRKKTSNLLRYFRSIKLIHMYT